MTGMSPWKAKQRRPGAVVSFEQAEAAQKEGLEDDAPYACRICFEETRDPLQLISPCLCKGTRSDASPLSRHRRAQSANAAFREFKDWVAQSLSASTVLPDLSSSC
jgi:hypothetical protein